MGSDTCYVLSFAIIMLNTSLHNPSVRDKPSVDQFVSMNRGINDGGDLPRELLVSLYESIKTEPFKIPEDDGNDLMHTFLIRIEKVGCGSKVEDIKAGNGDGSY